MFKPAIKSELSQVSLTGMRAIILLGLLTESPRTLKEIRDTFISLNIMEEEHSDDIIRIDLNTLRSFGCEITKATRKNNYKYILEKSIFAINFSEEEIDVLKKAYKKIKSLNDIDLLLKYHSLFENLADYVSDNETKEILYGISVLKSFDCCLIKELLSACNSHNLIRLKYSTPGKNDSEKYILAQELTFNNDKIYLYGFDKNKNRSVILNIQRIKALISSIASIGDNIEIKNTYVKYKIKNIEIFELDKNEKIIENLDDGYIVEGNYYNDFIAIQRILSLGSNCVVLAPDEFRTKIIEKLKSMRSVYND